MLIECSAIALIIAAVALLYVRAKKRNYALATVPLLILPLTNILAYTLSGSLSHLLPMDKFTVYTAMNIIAVIASSCFVGVMSVRFRKKYTRTMYVAMSLIFNIVLASILVFDMFETLYR